MAECIHDLEPAACSMCSGRGEEVRAAAQPVFYVLACRGWFVADQNGDDDG